MFTIQCCSPDIEHCPSNVEIRHSVGPDMGQGYEHQELRRVNYFVIVPSPLEMVFSLSVLRPSITSNYTHIYGC
jgi:hypothetical protein